MVRLTTSLYRIPVIRFRKGGSGLPPPPPPAPKPAAPIPAARPPPGAGSCAMKPRPAAPQAQPAAPMSTGPAIPDVDLPARYRRTPLSDEEIDHINGGGIA